MNFVNNVVYDWRDLPTHRNNDGPIFVNMIGNYFINGPESRSPRVFNENGDGHSEVFVHDNYLDNDQDGFHNGVRIENEDARRHFIGFERSDRLVTANDAEPFDFISVLGTQIVPAEDVYHRLVDTVGPFLWRDVIDQRVINELETRTGAVIDSQSEFLSNGVLPGIDDLPLTMRAPDYDRDHDGMADEFELLYQLNPNDPSDATDTQLSPLGYTNLEVFLESLVATKVPEPDSSVTRLTSSCGLIIWWRRTRRQ